MSYLIEYHTNGMIQQCMTAPLGILQKAAEESQYNCLFSEFSATNFDYFVKDGQVLEKGEQPSSGYVFDYDAGEWVFALARAKDNKWSEIKAAREEEEFGTFVWGEYVFQCDEVSQRRIQGAVQLAALDPNFTIDWTLADNAVVNLTAQNMVDVGVVLATHVSNCHIKSRQLRININTASTENELDAINW